MTAYSRRRGEREGAGKGRCGEREGEGERESLVWPHYIGIVDVGRNKGEKKNKKKERKIIERTKRKKKVRKLSYFSFILLFRRVLHTSTTN